MAEEKILISVDVDTEKMQKDLSLAISKVASLKESQKLLTQGIIEGKDADGQMAKELARVTAELEKNQRQVKSQTAILQAATAEGLKENATLDEQRQYLNTLQKAYSQLSEEQRGSIKDTKSLTYQIKQLSDSVKEQEHAIGDDRRNVGNYAESIQKALPDLGKMKGALEGISGGSTAASKALDNTDKVMKGMASNPMIAIVLILGTLLQKVFDGLKKNEEAMEGINMMSASLGGTLKALQPILDAIVKYLVDNLLKAIEWVTDAIKKFLGWVDKIAGKFGKNLGLADAFEQGKVAVKEMSEEEKKAHEEALKRAEERRKKLADIREEIARRNRTDLENELHDLEASMQKELAVVGLTEGEKQQIRDYYHQRMIDAEVKAQEDAAALAEKEIQAEEEKQRKKLEARQKALESFGLVDGETPEQAELRLLEEARAQDLVNAEEYEIAKTIIRKKYAEKRAEDIQAEVEKATALYETETKKAASSASAALSALSNLLGEYAEESEEAAKAQKAFALGSILINQAMSIAEGAKGIAAAMAGAAEAAAATGPAAPVMLAVYQAQMVGQVLAIVSSVASSIVQAKQTFDQGKDAGNYAIGGIVPGTSYNGDNMVAHVNSREGIFTVDQQKRLFDIANGGASGYNYQLMETAMANAIAKMPAPSLALTELADAQTRVTTYNEIASI